MLWEECYTSRPVEMGFIRGESCSCVFKHPDRRVVAVVHGDDFTLLGTKEQLDWCEAEMAKAFELKLRGRMGERPGCVKEIRILNRVLRLCADGLRYEPDPRHVELLVKKLKVGKEMLSCNTM